MSQPYQVPLIYDNLRPAESLHLALDALTQLNRVAEGVYGNIRKQVSP